MNKGVEKEMLKYYEYQNIRYFFWMGSLYSYSRMGDLFSISKLTNKYVVIRLLEEIGLYHGHINLNDNLLVMLDLREKGSYQVGFRVIENNEIITI